MNKINILIPLAGRSSFFDKKDYQFPKPLIEIDSLPMIELVLEKFSEIENIINKFIFIVNEEDCKKYHIDDILRILTKGNCEIVRLSKETKGAACSALMAIDILELDKELIICNSDQIISESYEQIISSFREDILDTGVVIFNSIHPRWSYIRLDDSEIIETAEKRPLSNNAIAGFYYFKEANYFFNSAMRMIKKDANVNELYYIAPSLNELILENKKLGYYKIDADKYFSFYSPQKIKIYENRKN